MSSSARIPAQLQQMLLDAAGLEDFLPALGSFCVRELAELGVTDCALVLERARRPRLWAGSSDRAGLMEEGGPGAPGPCAAVLAGESEVLVADLAAHPRYRPYAASVAATGLRSVAALALALEAGSRGALACYAEQPFAFGTDSSALMRRFLTAAVPTLRLALRLDEQLNRAKHLHAALESRTVVDLAVGIIMGQNGCSQDAAVEILRNVSNSRNLKLRDVAAGVVAAVTDRVRTHFDD